MVLSTASMQGQKDCMQGWVHTALWPLFLVPVGIPQKIKRVTSSTLTVTVTEPPRSHKREQSRSSPTWTKDRGLPAQKAHAFQK